MSARPLMAIHAGASKERLLGAASAQHVPRRVSNDRVEAGVRERLSRLVEVRLRKFEQPVKEVMRIGDACGVVKKRRRRLFRQLAAPRHQSVCERCEYRRVRRRVRIRPHPACAPEIGNRFPSRARAQSIEPAFLFPDDIGGVILSVGQPAALDDGSRERRLEVCV